MEKLQIIPFRARHVKEIEPQADDAMMALAQLAQNSPGDAFTACYLGQPIGAAGIILTAPNMGDAWALLSPLLKSFPLYLHREAKTRIEHAIQKYQLRRVQAFIDARHLAHVLWIRRLGFQYEGTARAVADDGSDRHMYSRITMFHMKQEETTCLS